VQLAFPSRNRTVGTLDVLAFIGLLGFLVARFIPVATLPFWRCGFRAFTGVPCPGCGLTRVAERLAHFNVHGALLANPLGAIAGLVFVAAMLLSAMHLALGLPIPELALDRAEWARVRWAAGILFVGNYAWVVFASVVLRHQ
jgi:hypothetical protein